MFDINKFEKVFAFNPQWTYDEAEAEGIEQRRIPLEGLFIDKVLFLMGIKRRELLFLIYYCRNLMQGAN